MKRSYYLLVLLLIGMIVVSCKKDGMSYQNSFEKSYDSWLNFKKSSGNSYRYMVTSGSWTGMSIETVITVKEGKVVQRSYVRKDIDRETHKPIITKTWSEVGDSLNTHPGGAASLTLDEIYDKAKTEWLIKRDNAHISFEAKNNGMISTCGYRDKNCVDDCFRGITIDYIEGR
ncbi:MAG TPA: hypothetical protein VFX43_02245 [Chitinophagaceae bacterium]|nr:hypothetical protein [Chitinophagaceae bacterium]